MKRNSGWLVVFLGMVAVATSLAQAAPPWKKVMPFQRKQAVDNDSLWLEERHGPWMIFAASFAGPGAEDQARRLVEELRQTFQIPAYLHKREFDFTEPVLGLGVDKFGNPKKMRHAKSVEFDEYAVLVGSYPTFDDPEGQLMLEKIKYARPKCLDISTEEGSQSTQRYVGLRELYRKLQPEPKERQMGQMGRAFVARNPLLPSEYFAPKGLDPLVVQMNQNVKHSLLKNPGKFTVQVASFTGESYFGGEKPPEPKKGVLGNLGLPGGQPTSKLEIAADHAHRLTEALRDKGIEAYEFHDRHESIVTIGSFDSVGQPRADGKVEINPQVHKIMQTYGAERAAIPGQPVLGLRPKKLAGLPFDVQPRPVEVPKRSFGEQYTATAGNFD